MELLLEPLVGRSRGPQLHPRRARQLGGGLLAELAEPLRDPLERRPGSRIGVRQETQREADHDRLDSRLEQGDPGGSPERRKGEADRHSEAAGDEDRAEEGHGNEQRDDVERVGVERRDDDDGEHVVDDDHRQHERPKASRKAWPDEREQPEGEGGVGRHRDRPALGGGAPGVEREVDRDRPGRTGEPCQQGQREPAPLPELPEVELPTRLEPDHQEEDGHQPTAHPTAQVQRDPGPAQLDRELRRPERLVGGVVDVHPHQSRHCGGQ